MKGVINATPNPLNDKSNNLSKVAFTYSTGGTLNASNISDALIIKGNYFNTADYSASITAGKGNDTILAGGGDSIDAGDGDNLIEFSVTRNKSATIFST